MKYDTKRDLVFESLRYKYAKKLEGVSEWQDKLSVAFISKIFNQMRKNGWDGKEETADKYFDQVIDTLKGKEQKEPELVEAKSNIIKEDSKNMNGTDYAVQAIKHYFTNGKLDEEWLRDDVILHLQNVESLSRGMYNTRRPCHSPAYDSLVKTINDASEKALTGIQIQAGFKAIGIDFKAVLAPVVEYIQEEREEAKNDKQEESKEIKTESKSFEEIINDMELSEDYDGLRDAASYIEDAGLKNQVYELIDTCENDGDDVETAYSIVTTDLLDSRIYDENEPQEDLEESCEKPNNNDDLKLPSQENPEETKKFINDRLDATYNHMNKVGYGESKGVKTESIDDDIAQIQDKVKQINKALAYIRRRDRVSLSIGSDEEQEELYAERNELNAQLKKLRKQKADAEKSKEVKTESAVRDIFEKDLQAYISKGEGRSADDIKVLAETENYMLVGAIDRDNSSIITLTVESVGDYDRSEKLPEVYIEQNYKGKVESAKVNWSAYGSVSSEEATSFAANVVEAAKFATEIDGKDYSAIMNGKTTESKEIKEESRDRISERLPRFIYKLTSSDFDKYGETAWSGNEPMQNVAGMTLYYVYRNGKSDYTLEDIEQAVLAEFPELRVHGHSAVGNDVYFIEKDKKQEDVSEDERDNKIFNDLKNEEEPETIMSLLEDRIGEDMSVGELNTVLQSIFSRYNEIFVLTSDIYNADAEESQDVVIFDDADMYVITYKIKDQDEGIVEITDVTVE